MTITINGMTLEIDGCDVDIDGDKISIKAKPVAPAAPVEHHHHHYPVPLWNGIYVSPYIAPNVPLSPPSWPTTTCGPNSSYSVPQGAVIVASSWNADAGDENMSWTFTPGSN